MSNKPLFQHRHYVAIAEIISEWPQPARAALAALFSQRLQGTNPNFDEHRFIAAAMGNPSTGRDKAR